jgi:hypothetical protein
MSRASRTAELLAALQLAPLEVEREQVRARQQNATSRAIASLVPALIEGGASIAGDVIGSQKADARQKKQDERDERDALARIASRNTANSIAKTRADAAAAKAEADKVKAAADAAESTRKADEAAAKSAKETTVAGIEAGAGSAAAMLPTGGKRRVVGTFRPGESPLDEVERLQAESGSNLPLEQIGGMVDRQALEDRKSLADVKVAERKAAAPTGPKAPSRAQLMRERKTELEVEKLENEARGGPGSSRDKAARTATEKKQQQVLEVDGFSANIKRNIRLVKEQIAKSGTFELTGPEGAIITRRLNDIAIDLAKLKDPTSVARETEVESERRSLVDTGFLGAFTRDETAQAVLDALDADVDRRREEAYLVRGLDMAAPTRPATAADADAAELGFTIDED